MSDPVVILLPTPPSTNHLFAGAGKRRWRSPEYEAWILEAGHQLNRQHPSQVKGMVSLLIEVREPPTKRHEDLGNKEKALTDLLVTHGIIEGDSQHFVRRIVFEWSSQVEGARITISEALCPTP
jgi:Holliday junction resolvase RusA-like endonuclease